MPGAPLILAVDVGTSSARACLYDAAGRPAARSEVSLPYQPEFSADGGAWVGAPRLARLTLAAIDGAVARAQRPIAAVGVSTFWHSLLGLGANGKPVTPVLLWADQRSAGALPWLRARLGGRRAYHQRAGTPLHPSFWPAKLRWLATTQQLPRGARWISFADYFFLRLFGEIRTSVSMASATGLWNRRRHDWDEESLAALGVRRTALPEVSDEPFERPAAIVGRRWPALAGAQWYPAWGDGACANVGSGAVRPGALALTIGTSSALRAVVPSGREFELPQSLWRYAIDRRRHLVGGALSEGGDVYQWLRLTLGQAAISSAEMERRLKARAAAAHGLVMLPFFAGERSPGWRPERRAVIAGLSLATTPEDVLRAGLEAVALQLAVVLADLRSALRAPAREILTGGAALHQSDLWSQIVADALAAPLTRLADAQTSARGAALLAAERAGLGAIEAAPVPRVRRFLPRAAASRRYRLAGRRQQALYQRLTTPLPVDNIAMAEEK